MASSGIMFSPNFIKIGQLVKNLKGHINTECDGPYTYLFSIIKDNT